MDAGSIGHAVVTVGLCAAGIAGVAYGGEASGPAWVVGGMGVIMALDWI